MDGTGSAIAASIPQESQSKGQKQIGPPAGGPIREPNR